MQLQESLIKALRRLAAGTHGQISDVRTVMGRQLQFIKDSSAMHLLPYAESEPLYNVTTAEKFFMVDADTVDGTRKVQ